MNFLSSSFKERYFLKSKKNWADIAKPSIFALVWKLSVLTQENITFKTFLNQILVEIPNIVLIPIKTFLC